MYRKNQLLSCHHKLMINERRYIFENAKNMTLAELSRVMGRNEDLLSTFLKENNLTPLPLKQEVKKKYEKKYCGENKSCVYFHDDTNFCPFATCIFKKLTIN